MKYVEFECERCKARMTLTNTSIGKKLFCPKPGLTGRCCNGRLKPVAKK